MVTVFITIYTIAKTVSYVKDGHMYQLMRQKIAKFDRGEIRRATLDYLIDQPNCKIPDYPYNSAEAEHHLNQVRARLSITKSDSFLLTRRDPIDR